MQEKASVFISGGSGLLAINWAYTIRQKYAVHLNLHERIIEPKGIYVSKSNLGSLNDLLNKLEKINPVAIIHTAGLTNVEVCQANHQLAWYVNVELSANVAKAAKILGIPFVHISTDHLYQGKHPNINELEIVNPVNVYGYTKVKAEEAVLHNNEHALIIRTNFYGWGPSYRQSFSDRIMSALRATKEIVLFNDVYYTPILAEALILSVHELLEKKAKGIFNIVSDDRISKYEFGITIANEFNLDKNYIKPGFFRSHSALVQRPIDMSLSNNKVRGLLGRKIGIVADQIKRLHDQELEGIIKEIQLL
jgi:dTDP-4-dehydrorhamnose reductase